VNGPNFEKNFACVAKFMDERLQMELPFPDEGFCQATNLDRYWFMREEVEEYRLAVQSDNPAEVLDALVDLYYFLLGTMLVHNIRPLTFSRAFQRVHEANMSKTSGKKFDRYVEGPDVTGSGPNLEDLV
jgi:hypothetical protein